MSMRTFRLERKGGIIVAEIELLTENEPDAIVYDERVFIRRLMRQPTLPKKNDPECYFEATTVHFSRPWTAQVPAWINEATCGNSCRRKRRSKAAILGVGEVGDLGAESPVTTAF